jgi:hypothetical protein
VVPNTTRALHFTSILFECSSHNYYPTNRYVPSYLDSVPVEMPDDESYLDTVPSPSPEPSDDRQEERVEIRIDPAGESHIRPSALQHTEEPTTFQTLPLTADGRLSFVKGSVTKRREDDDEIPEDGRISFVKGSVTKRREDDEQRQRPNKQRQQQQQPKSSSGTVRPFADGKSATQAKVSSQVRSERGLKRQPSTYGGFEGEDEDGLPGAPRYLPVYDI